MTIYTNECSNTREVRRLPCSNTRHFIKQIRYTNNTLIEWYNTNNQTSHAWWLCKPTISIIFCFNVFIDMHLLTVPPFNSAFFNFN